MSVGYFFFFLNGGKEAKNKLSMERKNKKGQFKHKSTGMHTELHTCQSHLSEGSDAEIWQ